MKVLKLMTALFALVFAMSACETYGDPEVKYSSTYPVSGEWYIEYYVGDAHVGDFALHTISNTAADDGKEIWIGDEGNFWTYKVKCPVNMSNLTFAGTEITSIVEDYGIKISIANGKVMEKAATVPSGVKTDSIYFEINFEDDAATTYIAKGYKKTGFLEDEH